MKLSTLAFMVMVSITGLVLARDNSISRYSANYGKPQGNSVSRYSSNYKGEAPKSSFSQNQRSGYTNRTSKGSSQTIYNDGSYQREYRLTPGTNRIEQYNSLTGEKRSGIKYKAMYGYYIRYRDGSLEKFDRYGNKLDNAKITQRDNLGNRRSGNKVGGNTVYSDGASKTEYQYGSGVRVEEKPR